MKRIFKIIIIICICFNINIKSINAMELPKIFLTGDMDKMYKKQDERKIKLRYISNDLEFEAYTKIRVQGNSSLEYSKKNYRIKLYEDKEYSNKKDVDVGKNWGEQHKYYLKANWIDKTHSRNIVTSNVVASIQEKYNLFMDSPNNNQIDGFPIEVYLNNEFLGLYTWNIPKDNWMFNMDNNNPNHIAIIANKHSDITQFREKPNFENNDWEIEVGPNDEETIEKFTRLSDFIRTSSDIEFKRDFEKYLNLDATLNYYVITKTVNLCDNLFKNLMLITYDGKVWYPNLYDLDTSWGVNWKGNDTLNYKDTLNTYYEKSLLWEKFEKNFKKEIADRYFELRKNLLTKNNILSKFNKFYNNIPTTSLQKENNRWDNIPGYDISQIEEFLNTRFLIIDEEMYNLYDIHPQVNIEYSTKKTTLRPVTVTLIPNRNDIVIVKNGKKSYDYKYKFKDNGIYTFEYQDWLGNNIGTITIEINCIKTKLVKNIIIILFSIFIIFTLYFTSKNKKKTIKKDTNPNKKEKNLIKKDSKKDEVLIKKKNTKKKSNNNNNKDNENKKKRTQNKKNSSINNERKNLKKSNRKAGK